jgi:tetratricopeptide (TPR) repeat protein
VPSQPTLRLTQHPGSAPGRYRVEVAAAIDDRQLSPFSHEFAFEITAQDRADLRWYLEDYLEFPEHPAGLIAARVEQRMAALGDALFHGIFHGSDAAREVWMHVRPRLADARIEVVSGIAEATAIPWELMRDPRNETPLALTAQAFVRSQRGAPTIAMPAQRDAGKVWILLVICRPKGDEDVPFRSVANRLAQGLNVSEDFDLDVLRPPTFEALARTVRAAKDAGKPFHIVHFDGHGTYADPADLAKAGHAVGNLRLDGGATGRHGFLMFEDPENKDNAEYIDGGKIGKLLTDNGVPVLVLNACQSAYAEAAPAPTDMAAAGDGRAELRGFGSLAQEVIDAGTAGVVAMRYSVYVVTAAQFVAELYRGLAGGQSLGEAVTLARKHLAENPEREIAYGKRVLQDWCVPVVYERARIALWPKRSLDKEIELRLDAPAEASPLDKALPAQPDVGFFGRDETLYAIDRAFDRHRIVLLHAFAGAGKTSTAIEFARWYVSTGGIEGAVLFSSFERHLPLARLLDKIGEVFGAALERAGKQWDAITDAAERRRVALWVLSQVPALWIWDNVEPITGFPAGTPSEWTAEEQRELLEFLRALRGTKAKVLLTSRRDERAWLGDLPVRVAVPPMPMRERLLLAGAIVERHGKRLAALPDLRPLLDYTAGNPLTILAAVGQALRDGMATEAALSDYVARLRAGEEAFEDEAAEGRTKSLGASLSYGFARGFGEDERKILALLHLFQGCVDVDALRCMGDEPSEKWCLAAVSGLTRESGTALLDRAAECGLLTALGKGYYRIHPALPWFFRGLFAAHFPVATGEDRLATRAFVEAMGSLGDYYHNTFAEGNSAVFDALRAEEDNLLVAFRLAHFHGWLDRLTSAMQGLRALYDHTGRRMAWRQLVEIATPNFVDPTTQHPLPGREGQWILVSEYRVRIMAQDRQWPEAEQLQQLVVWWQRQRVTPLRALDPTAWTTAQRNDIRSLAVSLHELGEIQREQAIGACADTYRESLAITQQIGDRRAEASCAYNLGRALSNIPELRDLTEAENWYRRSLDLLDHGNNLTRGKCHNSLGSIAQMRFIDALRAGHEPTELLRHLNDAINFYQEGLKLIPDTAPAHRAVACSQLGSLYGDAGEIEIALRYYRQGIRYLESSGDIYAAAQSRFNVSVDLLKEGRVPDALAFAEAALHNFKTYGDRAADKIEKTQNLIALIRDAQAKQANGAPP